MNTSAIVMMVLAMLIIWGGLAAAILNLRRSPELPRTDETNREV